MEKEDVKRLNLNTQLKIELFCLLDSFESCLKKPLDQSLSWEKATLTVLIIFHFVYKGPEEHQVERINKFYWEYET